MDELTTALDATARSRFDPLREYSKAARLAIIFVTHDIGAAVEIADRVAVMYAGRIVEEASMTDILSRPRHPYTQVLLGSRPKDGLKRRRVHCIPRFAAGSFPLAAGCAFADRCPHARAVCTQLNL